MSITHRQNLSLQSNGGNAIQGTINEVGATEITIDQLVATGTNTAIACAFAFADLESCIIVSDQDATLETNDGTTPDDVFALKAGMPLEWSKSAGYFPNPFTADVTGLFLTNATPARLRARFLLS